MYILFNVVIEEGLCLFISCIVINLSVDITLTRADKIKALEVWFDFKLCWSAHGSEVWNRILKRAQNHKKKDGPKAVPHCSHGTSVLHLILCFSSVAITRSWENCNQRSWKIALQISQSCNYGLQTKDKQRIDFKQNSKTSSYFTDAICCSLYSDENVVHRKTRKTEFLGIRQHIPKKFHRQTVIWLWWLKIGRQITKNCCGSVLAEINVPRTSEVFNKDRLRRILKPPFILLISLF